MRLSSKNRFDRRKEQTRRALRRAAQALILEKGFALVTVDDIVRAADVARGTFYLQYRDKEALVWDIVDQGRIVRPGHPGPKGRESR